MSRGSYNGGRPQFRWRDHPEVAEFVRTHFVLYSTPASVTAELAEAFPQYGLTEGQVHGYIRNHNLRTGEGKSKKGRRYVWTVEMEDYVASHPEAKAKDLAEDVSRIFGVQMSRHGVEHLRWKRGYRATSDGRFRKGEYPANTLPVGTELIRDGYTIVKTGEKPSVWRVKAHVVWEEASGKPVPEGYGVFFLDNDPTNISQDNLEIATPSERCGLLRYGIKWLGNKDLVSAQLALIRLLKEVDGNGEEHAEGDD